MSLRGPRQERRPRDKYYTPPWVTRTLLDALPLELMSNFEAWEPAAGSGLMARELARHFPVLATDLAPDARQVHAVGQLDFLASTGPSGHRPLAIITNPPYGTASRTALAFLAHALHLAARRNGLVALLLPFEFDAAASRSDLIARHPDFAAKLTLGRRIRWANLAQSANPPMGHHAWFIWAFHTKHRQFLREVGTMRTLP